VAIKHASGLSTRDEILRLTVEAIDGAGEGGVHVSEIAKASNVAVTSIYHFFDSREGLIEAAQASRFAREFTVNANAFSDEVAKCSNQEEFRALLRQSLPSFFGPDGARRSADRVNVLGSTFNRPSLTAAVSDRIVEATIELSKPLHIAQNNGWIRQDLNIENLAAWYIATITSYAIVELTPATQEFDWVDTFVDAADFLLFGEK
jgi:AcrR family transcriptional regulator